MSDKKPIDVCPLSRRDFIKVSGSGVAGLMAAQAIPPRSASAATGPADYPVVNVARLSEIEPGTTLDFAYPDEDSPALLVRLSEAGEGGVGPAQDIVAYSILCTHKGCVVDYKPQRKLLICPCHWSTFDPAKAGALVIGQASQALPQIELRIEGDTIQAVGVSGLIYGRHTNIL